MMKIYNLNIKNSNWLEDSSFIGFSTYFVGESSYFIIDLDLVIDTRYESETDTFTSYISPAKLVLKDFSHVDINIRTIRGKNSVQQDPFIIERLRISDNASPSLAFEFELIGDGSYVVYAMEGRLFVPNETILKDGQELFLSTEIRDKYVAKYFKDGFFRNQWSQ